MATLGFLVLVGVECNHRITTNFALTELIFTAICWKTLLEKSHNVNKGESSLFTNGNFNVQMFSR